MEHPKLSTKDIAVLRQAQAILHRSAAVHEQASNEADRLGHEHDADFCLTRATAQNNLAEGLKRELNALEGQG